MHRYNHWLVTLIPTRRSQSKNPKILKYCSLRSFFFSFIYWSSGWLIKKIFHFVSAGAAMQDWSNTRRWTVTHNTYRAANTAHKAFHPSHVITIVLKYAWFPNSRVKLKETQRREQAAAPTSGPLVQQPRLRPFVGYYLMVAYIKRAGMNNECIPCCLAPLHHPRPSLQQNVHGFNGSG